MKILFISHNASRNGAPIILLNIIKWLKAKNPDWKFLILCKDGGELVTEFEKYGDVFIWKKRDSKSNSLFNIPLVGKYLRFLLRNNLHKINDDEYIDEILINEINLIYANTVAVTDLVAKIINRRSHKVILHVHELIGAIEQFCGLEQFNQIKPKISKFIAASKMVKDSLTNNFSISDDRISVHYEFIDCNNLEQGNNFAKYERFGLPKDAFIVGFSGTNDVRKGLDLIPSLLNLVNDKSIYFVWLAGNKNSTILPWVLLDLKKLELDAQFIYLETVPNPSQVFQQFDIFVLLSREDPFPLVCLENALLQKPLLIFENSTGIEEILEIKKAGKKVPYLDIIQMAKEIIYYKNNPAEKVMDGKNARDIVVNNFDADIVMPGIYLEIQHQLTSPN